MTTGDAQLSLTMSDFLPGFEPHSLQELQQLIELPPLTLAISARLEFLPVFLPLLNLKTGMSSEGA